MKIFLKAFAIIVLFFIAIQIIPPAKTTASNPFILKKGDKPQIIAHGGAKLLFPENTMVAFDGSAGIGVDILEMDIRITKDGVLVTHHNETIDETSNGKGRVIDLTFDELQKFNFGYNFKSLEGKYTYRDKEVKIPTLEDVIKKYNSYNMIIELKDEGETGFKAAEKLKELLTKYNMENKVIIASFNDDVLNYFKKITGGKIRTSTAHDETQKFTILHLLFSDLFYFGEDSAFHPPTTHGFIGLTIHFDTKRFIRSAHRRNMAVQYWTINDKEEMKKLIEIGADGLMTDRPDLMKELLSEMGYNN